MTTTKTEAEKLDGQRRVAWAKYYEAKERIKELEGSTPSPAPDENLHWKIVGSVGDEGALLHTAHKADLSVTAPMHLWVTADRNGTTTAQLMVGGRYEAWSGKSHRRVAEFEVDKFGATAVRVFGDPRRDGSVNAVANLRLQVHSKKTYYRDGFEGLAEHDYLVADVGSDRFARIDQERCEELVRLHRDLREVDEMVERLQAELAEYKRLVDELSTPEAEAGQ